MHNIKAVMTLLLQTNLTMVDDGAKLMLYLSENSEKLPDVLLLDYNMPRKNGFECLSEINHSNSHSARTVCQSIR